MRSPLYRILTAVCHQIEPLWPAGLAVVALGLGDRLLPWDGEAREWALYFLLAAVVPAACLVRRLVAVPPTAGRALAVVGLAVAWWLATRHPDRLAPLALALGQGVLLLRVVPRDAAGRVVALGVFGLAWVAAARGLWWTSLGDWLAATPLYTLAVLLGATLLAARFLGGSGREASRWGGRLTDATALALLTATCLFVSGNGLARVHPLLPHHHWGALVGPAHVVRQGGWLLWDTPSQYGFLSTLAIAITPIRDIWKAGYAVNAGLSIAAAFLLYRVLRGSTGGPVAWLFALLATVAAVFLIPGQPPDATSAIVTPAVGPFRFFWCYVLVAVLAWEQRTGGRVPFAAGCLAWLVGSLWSAESAAYCAVVWLPAAAVIAWRRAGAASPTRRLLHTAILLSPLPLLAAGAVALIEALYRIGLGHGPDWSMFVDYCRALGVFALPIEADGPVWLLVVVFVAVAVAAAHVLGGPAATRDVPLLLGGGGALWAAASYFVGRSHDVNATNLSPMVLLAVAAAHRVVEARRPLGEAWPTWVRLGLIPAATVLLAAAFGTREPLARHLTDIRDRVPVVRAVPVPTAPLDLTDLLNRAGVGRASPLLFCDNNPLGLHFCPAWRAAGHVVASSPVWQPAGPLTVLIPLPPERSRLFFIRFTERTRRSGWLLEPDEPTHPTLAWLPEQLRQTHAAGPSYRGGGWRLTWYECRSSQEGLPPSAASDTSSAPASRPTPSAATPSCRSSAATGLPSSPSPYPR